MFDIRNLRADDLRFLLAVANTGRLIAAADALGVDHTTVSRRIRALERTLDARLVERGTDGWELTETGRAVAEHARPIQAAVERAAMAAAGTRPDAVSGTIRITAPDGFGAVVAMPAVKRVREQHPNLNIELITATRHLIMHQSGFDLAIAVGKPSTPRLATERLGEYALALYASEDYLTERGCPTSVDELESHTLIFYIDSLLQVDALDLAQYLPGVSARLTSTNIFAQLEATRIGAGIGLLPKFLARRAPELRPVDVGLPQMRLTWTLAARRDGVSRPAVQAVREQLHRQFREHQSDLL